MATPLCQKCHTQNVFYSIGEICKLCQLKREAKRDYNRVRPPLNPLTWIYIPTKEAIELTGSLTD